MHDICWPPVGPKDNLIGRLISTVPIVRPNMLICLSLQDLASLLCSYDLGSMLADVFCVLGVLHAHSTTQLMIFLTY